MHWLILIVAGLFEAGFAFCLGKLKDADGAAWYGWGAGFLLSLTLSTVVLGIAFLHEPATLPRLFFVTTLIASVVGLKMV